VARGNPKQIHGLEDLARDDVRVALGNPHHVCVGLYAVETLYHSGFADAVKPRIIGYTESCAKTATIVALNGADAALGWRVFESWNPEKIETIPLQPDQVPRLSYMPIAVSTFSEQPEVAAQLVEYFCSEKARNIFEKWGYLTREEDARKYAPDAAIGGDYALPEGW
jgi:molybdate transport system substrate-binding protein